MAVTRVRIELITDPASGKTMVGKTLLNLLGTVLFALGIFSIIALIVIGVDRPEAFTDGSFHYTNFVVCLALGVVGFFIRRSVKKSVKRLEAEFLQAVEARRQKTAQNQD